MKNKAAAGPDDLKVEFYKALISSSKGLKTLTVCLQRVADEVKPMEWKQSKTKMIPKKKKTRGQRS